MDIGDMRREFESEGLDRSHLNDDPVLQFGKWFDDARTAGILEPNAMSLATTGSDQMPDLRTVLLKDRKSTRLNSSHVRISYAVFCLKKKKQIINPITNNHLTIN